MIVRDHPIKAASIGLGRWGNTIAEIVVRMPTDIELFEISGGGVLEPKADWTAAAAKHFWAALDHAASTNGIIPRPCGLGPARCNSEV